MCPKLPSLRALAVLDVRTRLHRLLKDPDYRHVLEGRSFEVRVGQTPGLPSRAKLGFRNHHPVQSCHVDSYSPHVLPDILTANAVRP
jgi:hypothetical protein